MSLRQPGAVLLISCYELGHQPMGIAGPRGALVRAGFEPAVLDIAVDPFDAEKVRAARFVGISVPMHTALRLGARVAERIREINAECHLCFYGMYAALNADYLRSSGADSCLGGEVEAPLTALVEALDGGGSDTAVSVHLERSDFAVPSRDGLPTLERYAHLDLAGECRVAGYVEASRGCKHLCTHCPIPPVYEGRFFVVPPEVVLEDIRRQVAAGATHITFGDPDFLNGPGHALKVVRRMHEEFPELTFDFTAKVEHLLARGDSLAELAASGGLFAITAVESLNDDILRILDKGHSRADVDRLIDVARGHGLALRPTWVPFTPWTTLDDYRDILRFVGENALVDHIDPVQYAIRLLVPPGSWLADHEALVPHRGALDRASFSYRWTHPDPRMDALQKDVSALIETSSRTGMDAGETFDAVCGLAEVDVTVTPGAAPVARLTESWFC